MLLLLKTLLHHVVGNSGSTFPPVRSFDHGKVIMILVGIPIHGQEPRVPALYPVSGISYRHAFFRFGGAGRGVCLVVGQDERDHCFKTPSISDMQWSPFVTHSRDDPGFSQGAARRNPNGPREKGSRYLGSLLASF